MCLFFRLSNAYVLLFFIIFVLQVRCVEWRVVFFVYRCWACVFFKNWRLFYTFGYKQVFFKYFFSSCKKTNLEKKTQMVSLHNVFLGTNSNFFRFQKINTANLIKIALTNVWQLVLHIFLCDDHTTSSPTTVSLLCCF